MTLDQALTISSTRTVDLWRLCVGEHAGWSPDSLREQALDILTEEVLRLQAELDAAGPQERDTMTNPDLDRALAAADANVGPSALDTLAREVRRLQGEVELQRGQLSMEERAHVTILERAEAAEAALAALQQGQADLTQRLADIHVVAGQHVGVTDLRIGPSLDDWNHLERLSRPALAAWRARQKGTPT